jgi:hypothetical protein
MAIHINTLGITLVQLLVIERKATQELTPKLQLQLLIYKLVR